MKFLDTISAVLRAKQAPTAARVEELLSEAQAGTTMARTRLAELEAQRSEKALASEQERQEYRAALNAARDDIADGEAAIEALRGRHAAALESEAEDSRRRRYEAARTTAGELSKLISSYEKHSTAIREIVAKVAEIDAVVRAANSDLPAGALPLAEVYQPSLRSGRTPEVLSERTVQLWVREGHREPLAEEFQGTVAEEFGGRGYTQPAGARSSLLYNKRSFLRREIREAVDQVRAVGFGKISLPDAYAPKSTLPRPVVVSFEPVKASDVAA